MKRRCDISDERGATLIEVTVGMATGMIVLFALTTMLITTMHSSARVSARVDANRNARLTINRVTEQLRSSCVAPRIAPVQKDSTGTSLRFIHQTGSGAVLEPVLSRIDLVGGTLTQYDYELVEGSMPDWKFASTPTAERQLATGISPLAPSEAVFTYLGYSGKAINLALPAAPLSAENAARTVAVRVAFSAAPTYSGVVDASVATQVRDTALLRLTTLAFNKETDEPCL
jgi:type II secretory pathway component PulJ